MIKSKAEFEAVGNSLLEHARDDASTSRHGIVDELFGFIVQASKKMSARAISRFLEEKHGLKISYVTVGRALRQPDKYWNLYYDSIEPHAWVVSESFRKPLKSFISEPEKYQKMLEGKPTYQVDDVKNQSSVFKAEVEFEKAVAVLDDKWFCFDEDILEDARRYLIMRLVEKPVRFSDQPDRMGGK